MSEITELRKPYPGDYIQPSEDGKIGGPNTDMFVGKRVLEGFLIRIRMSWTKKHRQNKSILNFCWSV